MFPERRDELLHFFESISRYGVFVAFFDDINEGDEEVWAMNQHVQSPEEIEWKFSSTSYQKASAVFKMFHEAFGEGTWSRGIRYFIKDMQFSPAEPKDLYRSLQKAFDEDNPGVDTNVGELFDTWANQPGFPIVNLTKLPNNKLLITQQRFPFGDEIYSIPITFATSSNPNFDDSIPTFWLTNKSIEIDYNDDWIIFNIQQTGFYRVNYDQKLWNEIINQLNRNHTQIHFINRRFLFDNLLFAASANFVDLVTSLRLLEYMKDEKNEFVWDTAEGVVANLCEMFYEEWFHEDLMAFLRNVFEFHYEMNGYVEGNRKTYRACMLGVEKCSKDALDRLLTVMDGEKEAHDDVYCNGLRVANATIFWTFFKLIAVSDDLKFRSKLLEGLACSNNKLLLIDYLNMIFDRENSSTQSGFIANLSDKEKSLALEAVVTKSKLGGFVSFEFLTENVVKVYET
jgi:aminopeptidase N